MYSLQVFLPDATAPAEVVPIRNAADVLTTIPQLLKRHSGCSHVVVAVGVTRLFSVDCHGQRVGD